MNKKYILLCAALLTAIIYSCKKDADDDDTQAVVFDGTLYDLPYGDFPEPDIADDNELTVQGVKLGRLLFHDTRLSKDGSQSCASCHRQVDAFSDTAQFSIGVEGMEGGRQAMAIFNMAWHTNEFFWDGRAHLLRDQALLPIQDPLEMNETLDNVIAKVSASQTYKDQFMRTFGSETVTSERISLALEQFMNSIVSNNSKYDQYLAGDVELTESEERGRLLFETEYNPFFPDKSGADCAHCHGGFNFENDDYMNNGLDADGQMEDFGRENATEDPADRGKFKVPSLRNVAVTPPYMHDGRFQTLEEVIDHYNDGVQESATLDPAIATTVEQGLLLTDQDKEDLLNFLHTLTDYDYLTNPEYNSPF